MKLLITTQVYENYAWLADGTIATGVNAFFKAKGANDYVIRNFKGSESDAAVAVMALRSQIEKHNDYYKEHVVGWQIVSNDYLTDFERGQLEYDGKITHSPEELVW